MLRRPKRKYASGGDILAGVGTGASLGATVGGPWGAIIGGVVGGIGGAIFGDSKERKEKKQRDTLEREQNRQEYVQDLSYLQAYNNTFNMAKGGQLNTPILIDGGYAKQLADGIIEVKGNTHEEGGVQVDTNGDSFPEAEVEDAEVINNEMVFSNRLRATYEGCEYLKYLGFNIEKGTYAEMAKKLGNLKGKYEEKLESFNIAERNTGMLMIGRVDEAIDFLFLDQELRKANGKN